MIEDYAISLNEISPKTSHSTEFDWIECSCDACWAERLIELVGCEIFLDNYLNYPYHCIKNGSIIIKGKITLNTDNPFHYYNDDKYSYLHNSLFEVHEHIINDLY